MGQFIITKETEIFVYCPAGLVTGGTELLHQLVDFLNKNGRTAYIVYKGLKPHIIPQAFGKYEIRLSETVVDDSSNIEIIPETMVNLMSMCNNTQKGIWWMSVDNYYFINNCIISDIFKWNPKFGVRKLVKKMYNFIKGRNLFKDAISLKQIRKLNLVNLYQSEYARQFVSNNNLGHSFSLGDYINLELLDAENKFSKKNLVLYNPSKGYKFTKKIISKNPGIKFIALKGFSRSELKGIMSSSKIYIDFGNHPGKDRLPRECAMNGCVIITGKRGAAGNTQDICIDNKYKFEEKQLTAISKTIENVLANYDENYKNQEGYRSSIIKEKNRFENEIREIFHVDNTKFK